MKIDMMKYLTEDAELTEGIKGIQQIFENKLNREVGKAFYMGKVEALTDEGYAPGQIAEKLDKPESVIRNYISRIEKEKSKQ